jgi:hypothetical protein
MGLFTKRNEESKDRYVYGIVDKVRRRVLIAFAQYKSNHWGTAFAYEPFQMIKEAEQILAAAKGGIPLYEVKRISADPIVNYFLSCPDEDAIEFIQMCFQTTSMDRDGDACHALVQLINSVFEEEGIGYEFTFPKTIDTGEKAFLFGHATGRNLLRTEAPRAIKKNENTVHQLVIKPALKCLEDPRLATANKELLDAFDEVRDSRYADAITSCGAAFESVLKTICTEKTWAYDPNKDTCASLVGICKANGLFFPFYGPIMEGVGTVRNKLGDAHGKGPKPVHIATKEHAEHMIAMTSAHIEFVLRLSGF